MTRSQYFKEIAHRTGYKSDEVRAIIEASEQLVLEIIAVEDKIDLGFAVIEGKEVPPHRISGNMTIVEGVRANFGYSKWLRGVPAITWKKVAKEPDKYSSFAYFYQPEHKYQTEAYLFRKAANLQEIDEYKYLDEDTILQLCEQADIMARGPISKKAAIEEDSKKKYKLRDKLARRDYWAKTGYRPVGQLNDPALGDKNWTGKSRTVLDIYDANIKALESINDDRLVQLKRKRDQLAIELEKDRKKVYNIEDNFEKDRKKMLESGYLYEDRELNAAKKRAARIQARRKYTEHIVTPTRFYSQLKSALKKNGVSLSEDYSKHLQNEEEFLDRVELNLVKEKEQENFMKKIHDIYDENGNIIEDKNVKLLEEENKPKSEDIDIEDEDVEIFDDEDIEDEEDFDANDGIGLFGPKVDDD